MGDIFLFFKTIRFADIIDIAIITGMFYCLLLILRETRSATVLRSVLAVILAGLLMYALGLWLELTATILILEKLWWILLLAIVMIFQMELRKAFMSISEIAAFRRLFTSRGVGLDEVLKAVRVFSRQKIGALICIGRRDNLKIYSDTGVPMDAVVSSELLRTIFMTYSPLHDGAVIIRGERVVAAGCILPLTNNPTINKELGTRHRAGIGLTDETDAIVIVVSEETGTISLATSGNLERHHTLESLKEALSGLLEVEDEK